MTERPWSRPVKTRRADLWPPSATGSSSGRKPVDEGVEEAPHLIDPRAYRKLVVMSARTTGPDTRVDPFQLRLEIGHFILKKRDERLRLTHIGASPRGQVRHRRRRGHRP